MCYPFVFYRCILCVTVKKDDPVISDDSETDEDEHPKDEETKDEQPKDVKPKNEPCDENGTKNSKTMEDCENKDTKKEKKEIKTKKDKEDTRDEETKSPEGVAKKKSKDKCNPTEKKGIPPSCSFFFLLHLYNGILKIHH